MTAAPVEAARGFLRKLRVPHVSKENRQIWSVLLGAVVAQTAGTGLVSNAVASRLWAAILGGVGAYLATTCKRGPLLLAATVSVVASHSFYGVVLGLGAVVAAALSTARIHRRAVFARGAAGALAVTAVLVSSDGRVPWVTSVVAVLVAAPIVWSGLRHTTRTIRRRVIWIGGSALALAVVASVAAVIAVYDQVDDVDLASAELEFGLAAARVGDAPTAATHLARSAALARDAADSIDRLGTGARLVPFVSQHVSALVGTLGGAEAVADQASVAAALGSSEDLAVRGGRVDPDAIAALTNPLRRLAERLGELRDEIDDHLDEPLMPALRDRLERLGDEAARAHGEADRGATAATVVPEVLGASGPRRYLVLFTSPAEARGRFGFPGSFAEVVFDDGRFLLGEQGTSSVVFNKARFAQGAFDRTAEQLSPYLGYGVTSSILSATIPPDWPTVARVVAEQWVQSGREPLDGVLRMDPTSLAPLLALTGPVKVATVPEPITGLNIEQFLLFDQYVQFPNDQAPRREVLDEVADVTFQRLVSAALPPPRTLIELFAPAVRGGHFDIEVFDDAADPLLDGAGLSGRFEATAPDELALFTINNVGNKIDTFLDTSVRYEAEVDGNRLAGDVTIGVTNEAPAGGLPQYVIGSSTEPPLPRGTNRLTALLYTRVVPVSVAIDGTPKPARIERIGDRYLTSVPLELGPGGSAEVVVHLDGSLPDGTGSYGLRLLPGGGARPTSYDVRVIRHSSSTLRHESRVRSPLTVG